MEMEIVANYACPISIDEALGALQPPSLVVIATGVAINTFPLTPRRAVRPGVSG